ncbi:MAG: hypothetical protein K6F56_01315 [Oscillospiraceae bacterium]|nr:hypothetical protein [Oscillospiraceae bacterium]
MKRTRFVLCLTLVLVLLLSLSPLAFADTAVVGQDASASGAEDGSVFLAGANTNSTAQVKGILFSAGNSVNAGGNFEYAMLAGADVSVSGLCENDAFLAGRSVNVNGETARDLYAAAQTISINGAVGRDLYAMADTVRIANSIGGDVYLNAGTIIIDDGVTIGGRLRYNSSAKVNAPQALIAAAEVYESEKTETEVQVPKAPTAMSRVKDALFSYVGLLLVGFALLWLTPLWESVDERYTGLPFGKYAAAFGIGLAILVGFPIVAILLMLTGFGMRLAFALLLEYAIILIAAPLVLNFFLGRLIWRGLIKKDANYWAELPIGLLVWRVLKFIPVVKTLVGFVAAPLAVGVLVLLLRWKKTSPKAKQPEAAPVFPAEPEPAAEIFAPAEEPAPAEEYVTAEEDPYPEPNPEPVAEEPVVVEEPVSVEEEPVIPAEEAVSVEDEPVSSEG